MFKGLLVKALAFSIMQSASLFFTVYLLINLASDPYARLAFGVFAVGLESAKIALIVDRHDSKSVTAVLSLTVALGLVLLSVTATTVSVNSTISEDLAGIDRSGRSSELLDQQIESTQDELATLQRNLDELPTEWPENRRIVLSQMEDTRERLETLIQRREELQVANQPGETHNDMVAVFLTELGAVFDVETTDAAFAFALSVALLSELSLFALGRRLANSDSRIRFEARKNEEGDLLISFIREAWPDQVDQPVKGFMRVGEKLQLNEYQARQFHERLKSAGVIETRGRRSFPVVPKAQAVALLNQEAA